MRLRKKVNKGHDELTTPLRSSKLVGLALNEIERRFGPTLTAHSLDVMLNKKLILKQYKLRQ